MSEPDNMNIIIALRKRLEEHNDNRIAIQEELHSVCSQLKKEIDDMEVQINNKLQIAFESEDNRLQKSLSDIQKLLEKCNTQKETNEIFERIKGDLFVTQNYSLTKAADSKQKYDLTITKNVSTELLSEKNINKIEDIEISSFTNGFISLKFKSPISDFERDSIKENNLLNEIVYRVNLCEISDNPEEENLVSEYILDNTNNSFYPESIKIEKRYSLKMKAEVKNIWESEWSDSIKFTPKFSEICSWSKCPEKVSDERKYTLNNENPRLATKTSNSGCWTTVLGNMPVPSNSIVSWDVKVTESRRNNGSCIMIGVAPPDVDQNADRNFEKSGYYFNCFESTLFFGPPCCFKGKEYGPRKDLGQYVHKGDTVSVIMDTTKGELSFEVNGVNLGVAFNNIPVDKKFVPCVILGHKNDSVELSF